VATIITYLTAARADPSQSVGTFPSVRDYLGATAADDANLKVWLAEAVVWVNKMVNGLDMDSDELDMATAGIWKYMRVRWDEHARASMVARKSKTGRREEEYTGAEAGRIDAAKLAAWSDIAPLCEDPTLFASGGGW